MCITIIGLLGTLLVPRPSFPPGSESETNSRDGERSEGLLVIEELRNQKIHYDVP
jgi:hypothetical protein